MNLNAGDVVMSLAGRDAHRTFFVISVEDGYALIADGKLRPAERPKRKKLKHLRRVGSPDCEVVERLKNGEQVRSSELRKGMASFEARNKEGG